MSSKPPNFRYEKRLWKRGYKLVAGADEVGRGALAGPVVAAAVVFPHDSCFILPDSIRINDSKKLTPQKREKASKWIKQNAAGWGIGEVSVAVINRLGMAKATRSAFRQSIARCNQKLESGNKLFLRKGRNQGKKPKKPIIHNSKFIIQYLLIDAFYVPYTKGLRRKNQLAIIKGDTKSFSIAAASIIAKVHRDKLMTNLAKTHRRYKWNKNKGYGTKEHQKAIKKWGITRLHRKQFVRRLISF